MLQDIRFALRSFRRSPGFTFAALLTLALGIGANTAIYSVIDAAVLHPAPFAGSRDLAAIYQASLQKGATQDNRNSVSYPNLLDWQQRTRTFEAIAGVQTDGTYTLTGRGEPEELTSLHASSNLLSILRVAPLAGRMFTAEEDRRNGTPVALLGEGFWRRRFASDPKIVGQTLRLNGRDVTVIGIVPAAVARLRLDQAPGDLRASDLVRPLGQNDNEIFFNRSVGDNTIGLGRLKPGVTLPQAGADMSSIMRSLAEEYPEDDKDTGVSVASYEEELTGNLRPVLLALGAAVGFVLLIAGTNVANLVLARSAGRSQEFAVRVALGAGRGRLIRQLLTENVILSLAGGALGLLIAAWSTSAILTVLPSVLPPTSDVQINGRVLAFTFAVALLTGMLFGFAPAFRAGRANLQETLRQTGRGVIKGGRRTQHALIVAEVALTLILLVGAGLMLRSLQNLWKLSAGFDPQNVLVFHTTLSPQRSASKEAMLQSFRELNARLTAMPGLEAAGIEAGGLPFMGNTGLGFRRADDPDPKNERPTNIYWISPDHFRAMGIPLLRGRAFTDQDARNAPLVAVIDEESARALFPGEDPLGKRLQVSLYDGPLEIVGIAGRVKQAKLDADADAGRFAQIYSPAPQTPASILPLMANGVAGIVRSKAERAGLLRAVRAEVDSFDGGAVFGEQWMTDAIAGSLAPRRFSLIVLGVFAGVALVLSFVGIYGVISYLMSQRTNEIGVRMSLGARPQDIFLSVLREGAALGATGIAMGLAGAAALTHLMAGMLYGIHPRDLATFAAAAASVFLCTLFACYAPARRAVRIDPASALRAS